MLVECYLAPEAEVLLQLLPHKLPCELFSFLFILLCQLLAEGCCALALVSQYLGVQFVCACAQYQSTCLMVGSDDNQGLIRMLCIELISNLYCVVHVYHLFK